MCAMLFSGVRPMEHLRGLLKLLWIVVLCWPQCVGYMHTGNYFMTLLGQVIACRGIAETVRNEIVQQASRCSGKYNSFLWLCTLVLSVGNGQHGSTALLIK